MRMGPHHFVSVLVMMYRNIRSSCILRRQCRYGRFDSAKTCQDPLHFSCRFSSHPFLGCSFGPSTVACAQDVLVSELYIASSRL